MAYLSEPVAASKYHVATVQEAPGTLGNLPIFYHIHLTKRYGWILYFRMCIRYYGRS